MLRYKYIPAQQEMKAAQQWLYTTEGRMWLDANFGLRNWLQTRNSVSSYWFSIKEDVYISDNKLCDETTNKLQFGTPERIY